MLRNSLIIFRVLFVRNVEGFQTRVGSSQLKQFRYDSHEAQYVTLVHVVSSPPYGVQRSRVIYRKNLTTNIEPCKIQHNITDNRTKCISITHPNFQHPDT